MFFFFRSYIYDEKLQAVKLTILLWGVKLIPCINPCDHCIGKLVEVVVDLTELRLDLLGDLDIAFLNGGAVLWERNGLEKRDELLLPVDTLVFLLQVHKRVASFAVPNVRQTRLHSQSQVVANHLPREMTFILITVAIKSYLATATKNWNIYIYICLTKQN